MEEDQKVCDMVITVGCFGRCVVQLCLCVFCGARGKRSCSRGRRRGRTGSGREGGSGKSSLKQRESTGRSNFLCAHEHANTCSPEFYSLYPNVLNVLNVAIVRVHVYPDKVPGVPDFLNVAVGVHVYPDNVPCNK